MSTSDRTAIVAFGTCATIVLSLAAFFWCRCLLAFKESSRPVAAVEKKSTPSKSRYVTTAGNASQPRNQDYDGFEAVGPTQLQHRATFESGSTPTSTPQKTLWNIAREKLTELAPKTNTYKYKPFNYHDDIRILKILHGKKDKRELECMLFPISLPSANYSRRAHTKNYPYWALSYWWGAVDEEASHPVTIYDDIGVQEGAQVQMTPFNPSGVFFIRHNLDAALRKFRHETEDIVLWVDALCINQGKDAEALKEKTSQVARMHEIYSEADHVCVWLGAGTDETPQTFEFLREILNLNTLDDLVTIPGTKTKWMLVVNLMKNRWFSRRWVIQELALAKKAIVRWGDEHILWEDFADAIALFMTKHNEMKGLLGRKSAKSDLEPRALGANTLVDATSSLFRKSDDGKIQQRLVNLEVLVSSLFIVFEASEPRDVIYAVLSLAKDTEIRVEPPNPPSWLIPAKNSISVFLFKSIHYIFVSVFDIISWLFRLNLIFRSSVSVSTTALHAGSSSSTSSSITSSRGTDQIDDRITPNYDKSLMDVCADFVEYCIEQSDSLDILCRHWAPRPKALTLREKLALDPSDHKQDPKHETENMPSWILSIEGHAYGGPKGVMGGRRHGDSFVGSLERQNQQNYNASGGLSPCVRFEKCNLSEANKKEKVLASRSAPNRQPVQRQNVAPEHQNISNDENSSPPQLKKFNGVMHVKGFRLSVIKKLTGNVLDGVIPAEAFKYGDWDYKHEDLDGKNPSHLPAVPDAIWRTLVADRGPDGNNAPRWYRRACLECLMHINGSGDLNTSDLLDRYESTATTMRVFLERVQAVVWRRKFFLTKGKEKQKPLYGLAPSDTKENDLICILFGCSVPVVLRKQPKNDRKGPDRYIFIGECYVHGKMYGEALPTSRTRMPEHPYDNVEGFTVI